MAADPTLVGLVVGTTGVKAIAISTTGEVLARAERGYPLSIPQPGWAEQDPEDWCDAAQSALDDLSVEAASIGLSGQMHGLVVLDGGDRVLRPAILWNDQRTAAECAEIEERVGLARLIELTGNRALPGFTAPKLLWLRNHEPETYAQIRHVLLPKDYVRLRMTGEHAIDAADASGTLLFDVARRRWSEEVCDALGIPTEWLPPAHESTEIGAAGDQAAGAPGAEGLLFQPYLAGERTPHADPNARAAFVGLSLRHNRGSMVRALLEGVAYGQRDSLELLRELGAEADVGRVSGGGARSPLWLK